MILAISGKRGAGKTTLAEMFVKKYKFKRLSFADELRNIAMILFPFNETDFSSLKKKESKFMDYDWTPREFLLNLGEFLRYHDKGYFIDAVLDKMQNEGRYVIDDLRYLNEAQGLRECDSVLVRLNRYEKDNPYGKNLDVESEKQLDTYQFDYSIHESRNTSLGELAGQCDHLFKTYFS